MNIELLRALAKLGFGQSSPTSANSQKIFALTESMGLADIFLLRWLVAQSQLGRYGG
jgi:hypothetical protein